MMYYQRKESPYDVNFSNHSFQISRHFQILQICHQCTQTNFKIKTLVYTKMSYLDN